jgi:hypothetical protein
MQRWENGSWRGDVWGCVVITCGLSYHCLLDILWGNLHATDLCYCAKLWTILLAIADITHQQFLHGWWFYEAKVPCIYGGRCPFWEAVCKGHSSGIHLFVLKVYIHLKHMIQGGASWGLLWLRTNVYLMRGLHSVLRVAFFWSVDYGYWWFDLGCTLRDCEELALKSKDVGKAAAQVQWLSFVPIEGAIYFLLLLWFDWQNSIIWHFSIQKLHSTLDTKIISTEKFSVLILGKPTR